jgi:hypothetical protein
MSFHSDYSAMIYRGRKAGLSTREIYSAISHCAIDGSEPGSGHADCNGYVSVINQQGQTIYRPHEGPGERA